jgi:hypothetical protein
LLAALFGAAVLSAQTTTPEKKYEDFDKIVKGAKEIPDGLFRLYHKDETLYAELQPSQLNKPFLCPIAIARGMGLGGFTLNFDEQWVLLFKKVGDHKLHLIRRNIHFQARKGSPVAGAVETTYTDSVLLALKIQSVHPGRQSILINLNDIFMRDFADLGIGAFDASRSSWDRIKSFPRNLELRVSATFSGGRMGRGDHSVIDPRGNTLVIHYALVELPDAGYQPRLADDRVGYFLSAVKDYSSDSKDTAFVRYVNRWRLERADTDPKHKDRLSVPKKRIVYWIEKTVPHEYRSYVREGILEWNKAFEKIGFRDAIEVRQQENEDFDPEDMNYNTFRWITVGAGFAMGPSRANPLTGEILDADIIFDADMIRYYKQQARLFSSKGQALMPFDEFPSPIQAIKRGWTTPGPDDLFGRESASWREERAPNSATGGLAVEMGSQFWASRQGLCECASCMKFEIGLAALAMSVRDQAKTPDKLPEEFIGQAIKEVVMHEVGHTLGLRHNFKASTMLPNSKLHDTKVTREKGLAGSVMDYLPVNLAPKGTKQGDYFMTTIGPYDYWAIEYAYKPLDGGTEGEWDKLQDIAKRGAQPGLDYGTDEDLYGASDPHIHVWDLGDDVLAFAKDRVLIAQELSKELADKTVDKGEGYQRLRTAFNMVMAQYGNAAFLASGFVGGVHTHRDHAGDPNGRDSFVPASPKRQREALAFLQEHILTDKNFQFPPSLLRRLGADRWYHWGNDGMMGRSVDVAVNERILSIQRVAMQELLSNDTLSRIQNNALKTEKEQPFEIAEVFRGLTDSVWSLPKDKEAAKKAWVSSVQRRNLQREHLNILSGMVLSRGQGARPLPPDARSLARFHLREIARGISLVLQNENTVDEVTRAHLEEAQERIDRVLKASLLAAAP